LMVVFAVLEAVLIDLPAVLIDLFAVLSTALAPYPVL